MNRLSTTFAGLPLRNPIIVSSSGLTDTAAKCLALEEAGAGAVVLKSIFEEQIMQEHDQWYDPSNDGADDYLSTYLRANSLSEHIGLIREAKRLCSIPIIASINCSTRSEWATYAGFVEDAGADALELNIMDMQTEVEYEYGTYERLHIEILDRVRRYVHLPVIVKLGMNLTNPVALVNQLYANGAAAVVMFNRPYRPDINIEIGTIHAGEMWTRPSDICDALRWVGISSARIPNLDYAVSGGVHDGWSAIKAIWAGASAVEVCTTIFWNGSQRIETMKEQMLQWMTEHGYETIAQFKGHLNMNTSNGASLYKRTQFMKYFSGYRGV
jgi:dihydroorotate dehydrogenase (fumarate)